MPADIHTNITGRPIKRRDIMEWNTGIQTIVFMDRNRNTNANIYLHF
jgi:hypothetical protein